MVRPYSVYHELHSLRLYCYLSLLRFVFATTQVIKGRMTWQGWLISVCKQSEDSDVTNAAVLMSQYNYQDPYYNVSFTMHGRDFKSPNTNLTARVNNNNIKTS